MLISNPMDQSIYYYMEGMAAPKGNFPTYGHKPKAVLVVDRSLEEASPGVYETVAKLRSPGHYDVAFYMDAPRVVHCFRVEVKSDEDYTVKRKIARMGTLGVAYLEAPRNARIQEEIAFRFRLHDMATDEVVPGLTDVEVQGVLSGGIWHRTFSASETAEPGTYEVKLILPQEGPYHVYVQCLSKGFSYRNPQYRTIVVSSNEN